MRYRLFFALLALMFATSCSFTKLEEQVEIKSLEGVSLKGFTAVELSVVVANDSRYRLMMDRAELELFMGGKPLMQLKQVGESVAEGRTDGVVSSLWRIEGVDPMTMLSQSSRLIKGDFKGVTLNYRARLSAGKLHRSLEGEGVDLEKFMTIFTK